MRGSPPCAVVVRRFVVWRSAVCVVALAGVSALVAWVLLAPVGQLVAVRVGVGLAGLASLALAASLVRTRPVVVRWDGVAWTVADPANVVAAPLAGTLDVAIDVGSFMLLRFTSNGIRPPLGVRWIPVERRGLEREWHSFRCAVYSPRPVAGSVDAADPQRP